MDCKHCHQTVSPDHKFCESCGQAIETEDHNHEKLKKTNNPPFSENILLGEDGVYRWTYGMRMWENPTILITVWKVLFIGGMFPVLLVSLLELFEQGFTQALSVFIPMFLGMIAFITVFSLIAYLIVAIVNGGYYQVVFELDDQGIHHIQMKKQFKKNQVIALLTILAGAASGSPQSAGAGLLAGSKQHSYSDFKKVKKIVAVPRRHVIYINESLEHNQVYVGEEDFDQVKAYIVGHCKDASLVEK